MSDKARQAAESIVAAYHEMNRMLPLAGGIPRPIEESTDKATVVALAYLAGQEEIEKLTAACEAALAYIPGSEVHNWPPGFQLKEDALNLLRAVFAWPHRSPYGA